MLPAERALLKVIAGRWKAVILPPLRMARGCRRAEGDDAGITQKVLIQQLREMEEHGSSAARSLPKCPPAPNIPATSLGLSLEPILLALCQWGQHHADELNDGSLADCIIRLRPTR